MSPLQLNDHYIFLTYFNKCYLLYNSILASLYFNPHYY